MTERNGQERTAKKPRGRGKALSLEASIMGMARSGELAKPAQLAIRRLRRKGIPITFRRGDKIITRYANGREEVLGVIEQEAFELPKGVKIIERN